MRMEYDLLSADGMTEYRFASKRRLVSNNGETPMSAFLFKRSRRTGLSSMLSLLSVGS